MKVCVLASGSKGNSVYIKTNHHQILIDIGISCINVERKLKEINVEPKNIDSIFITHTHIDHVAGLRVFTKKYKPVVYLRKEAYLEIKDMIIGPYEFIDKELLIDTLSIQTLNTSHDAPSPVGYILEEDNKSVVYMTDTGYIHRKNVKKLVDKNIYIMESNHDIEMLMNGKYPYHIKQRILGDKGHLSNEDSAYYMSQMITEKTEKIILAHLSHENNTEEKALTTYSEVLHKHHDEIPYIIIAKQDKQTELIEV